MRSATTAPDRQRLARIRVAIVDDHQLARADMRDLLRSTRALDVVGEAGDGREALSLCRDLRPDLVLVDIHMSGMDGLAFTRTIKDESPDIKVVIVTMHASPGQQLEALRVGADSLVLKDATRREILRVVRRAIAADPTLRVELAAQVVRLLLAISGDLSGSSAPLTLRECEVLQLLANGQTARAIGRSLHISATTLGAEVEDILAKLTTPDFGLGDRASGLSRTRCRVLT